MKRNSIIYKNRGRVNSTPLQWSRFGCTSYLDVKNKYGR